MGEQSSARGASRLSRLEDLLYGLVTRGGAKTEKFFHSLARFLQFGG